MLTIGKRQGFETETQEVLSSIGSAYCLLKRLGKNHKESDRVRDYKTETQEVLITYRKGGKGAKI